MSEYEPNDDSAKEKVASELRETAQLANSFDFDDIKSGAWFFQLLRRVVTAYDRNARAVYFQQKYPGLHPDEIADKLISVTIRYAAIAGAVAGVAITANQIATLSSIGMTAALWVTTIGAEMIYLARIQMSLILDLSVVYDLQLNADDPEDMLMIFGYALGVAPTDLAGRGVETAAATLTKNAIKEYISKDTLKFVQDFARQLGFKILQRDILKFGVPLASAAVGSTYNYLTTQAVGRIAKSRFKNRGKVTDELRNLVSRQNTYDLVFPVAALYLAQADGEYSRQEKEFYHALLTRMTFDPHTQTEFQKLLSSKEELLDAMAKVEDIQVKRTLIDVLVLMAIYDGKLAEEEREFLTAVAARLNVPIEIAEIEQRTEEYRVLAKKGLLRGVAYRAHATSQNLGTIVVGASSKVKNVISKGQQQDQDS